MRRLGWGTRAEPLLLNLCGLFVDRLGQIDPLADRKFPGQGTIALQVEHFAARGIADRRRKALAVSVKDEATRRGGGQRCGYVGNMSYTSNGGKIAHRCTGKI